MANDLNLLFDDPDSSDDSEKEISTEDLDEARSGESLEDEEPSEETEESEESTDEGSADGLSGRKLIEEIERDYGVSLSQYANDREALRGLVEAKRLVGRRDEDASLMREIRKKFGDGFVETLMRFNPEEATKKAQQQEPEIPFDESWLTMVRRDENGEIVPAPGAPPDIVAKLRNFAVHRERVMNAIAKSPKRFIESLILDRVNEIVDEKLRSFGSAYASVASKEAEKQRWIDEHYDYLYDENDNPTPLGEKFIEVADNLLEEHERAYGSADPLVCFKQAWEIVRGSVSPESKGYASAKAPAVHGKSVKTKSDFKDPQILLKELLAKDGVSLADAYDAVYNRINKK